MSFEETNDGVHSSIGGLPQAGERRNGCGLPWPRQCCWLPARGLCVCTVPRQDGGWVGGGAAGCVVPAGRPFASVQVCMLSMLHHRRRTHAGARAQKFGLVPQPNARGSWLIAWRRDHTAEQCTTKSIGILVHASSSPSALVNGSWIDTAVVVDQPTGLGVIACGHAHRRHAALAHAADSCAGKNRRPAAARRRRRISFVHKTIFH